MIQKRILQKELQKHGLFQGFKFNNQFQILKDNYKIRFLIDGVIATKTSQLIFCDMLLDNNVKTALSNISERYNTNLYIIDHFDWYNSDIDIEEKIQRCAWSTDKVINNSKIN
jgi:hypothetical protein